MPFYPASHYENIEKQKNIAEKVEAKKTQIQINKDANNDKDRKLTDKEYFKIQKFKTPKAPRPITIKDLEREMKIHDFIEERREEQIEKLLEDSETREIKHEILDVLAIPHTHPDKNKIFKYKLSQSSTINSYVDENVIFRLFNKANSHFKFSALYTIKYLQTHREYNQYVKDCERIRQQQQPQPNAEPEPEPEPETEEK
jgi:hypothetical protein